MSQVLMHCITMVDAGQAGAVGLAQFVHTVEVEVNVTVDGMCVMNVLTESPDVQEAADGCQVVLS